jgi:hypothetical protein
MKEDFDSFQQRHIEMRLVAELAMCLSLVSISELYFSFCLWVFSAAKTVVCRSSALHKFFNLVLTCLSSTSEVDMLQLHFRSRHASVLLQDVCYSPYPQSIMLIFILCSKVRK